MDQSELDRLAAAQAARLEVRPDPEPTVVPPEPPPPAAIEWETVGAIKIITRRPKGQQGPIDTAVYMEGPDGSLEVAPLPNVFHLAVHLVNLLAQIEALPQPVNRALRKAVRAFAEARVEAGRAAAIAAKQNGAAS